MNFKKLLAQSIIWRGFYFFSVLLVNVFLSRYLKAAGSGNLYFTTIIFSFTQVLLSLGFEAGITFFASGQIIQRNKLVILAGLWSIGAGVVMIGCTYFFFMLNKTVPEPDLWTFCLYSFLFVSGQALMNYLTAFYYTQENYFLPNFIMAIVNLGFVFIIPGKDAITTNIEIERIIFLYFFVFLLSGILLFLSYILYNRKEGAIGFPVKKEVKQFLKYSLTALAANVIFFLVYRVDYLFVNSSPVCTDADLGNYIQVSKLGQMMLILPQIVASVVFPRTASGIERERLNNSIMVIARLFSQLFLCAFIVVLFTGKYLFIKVFGPTFNNMQVPMLLIIPGIFSLSVLALLSAYFSGKGNLKVNVNGAILGLVVMIAGDFIFVPRYGIIAAAIISTISYTVNLGFSLYIFYKDYDINVVDFFKWRRSDYFWIRSLLARKNN